MRSTNTRPIRGVYVNLYLVWSLTHDISPFRGTKLKVVHAFGGNPRPPGTLVDPRTESRTYVRSFRLPDTAKRNIYFMLHSTVNILKCATYYGYMYTIHYVMRHALYARADMLHNICAKVQCIVRYTRNTGLSNRWFMRRPVLCPNIRGSALLTHPVTIAGRRFARLLPQW